MKESHREFKYLKLALDHIQEGISITSSDGKILWFNYPLLNLLGMDEKDLKGAKCVDLIGGLKERKQECAHHQVLLTGKPAQSRYYFESTGKWLEILCYPVKAKDGNISHIIHVFRDVEKEKDLDDLWKIEEKYKYFVSQTGEGFYRIASRVPIPIDLPEDEQIKMMYEHMYVAECNDIFAKMYGLEDAEEIKGKPFIELHGSPDIPENIKALKEFIRNGYKVIDVLTKERDKEGKTVYFINNAVGIIANNILIEVWGTQRDITDRMELMEKLKESKGTIRSILESISDIVIAFDGNKRFLFIHAPEQKFFCEDTREFIGKRYNEVLPDDIVKKLDSAWKEVSTGKTLEFEYHADIRGVAVWFSVRISPRYVGNKIKGAVAVIRDITRLKESERAIREAEARYRSIFENAVEGIFQSTPEGNFIQVNPAFARILGYDSPEDLKKSVTDIRKQTYVDPKDREKFIKELQEKGVVKNFEFRVRRKDGKVIWLSENARVVKDAEGKILYFEGTAEDITESKFLMEQLLQAQKMEAIGRVVGGIVHDFNNMLVPIIGYTEMLESKLDPESEIYDYVKSIKEAAQNAASLTKQLLGFTRRQVSNLEPLELNEFIKGTAKMFSHLIGEDIRVHISLSKDPIWVTADHTQLQQVLINMVVNARDAMPEGGDLFIKVESVEIDEDYARTHPDASPGKFACISVKDTGVGMDRDTMGRIFEPFFTTKSPGKGTGLGLSVAYGIIRQHNGWINVYSEMGMGTIFRIYIPLQERIKRVRKYTEPSLKETETMGKGECILVVEDDPQVRSLVASILDRHGYIVLQASCLKEAIQLAKSTPQNLNLLFTDVVLSDGNGPSLYEELKVRFPDLKVVFTSGYTDERTSVQSLMEKGYEFLPKPYSTRQLLEVIRRVFESE